MSGIPGTKLIKSVPNPVSVCLMEWNISIPWHVVLRLQPVAHYYFLIAQHNLAMWVVTLCQKMLRVFFFLNVWAMHRDPDFGAILLNLEPRGFWVMRSYWRIYVKEC